MADQQPADDPLLTFSSQSIFLAEKIVFKDVESIRQWTNDQINNITQILQPISGVFNGEELNRPFRSIFNLTQDTATFDADAIKSLLEQISLGASFSRDSKFNTILRELHLDAYERFGFICSALNIDPKNAFEVAPLKKTPVRAAFASGYVVAASLFLTGNASFAPARDKIDAALDASNKLADEAKAKLRAIDENFKAESADRERAAQKSSDRISKFIQSRANNMRAVAREHQKEMKGIRTSFEEYTALSGPISYWEKRAFWNYWVAFGAITLFVAFGTFVIWRLEADGPDLLIRIADIVQKFPEKLQSPLSFLILLSVPTLLVLWFLKFPARIFKEHLHIANDARHRKTLITTYLSLLREPTNPITPAERQYALQSIFGDSRSPSQDDPIPFLSELGGKKGA